MKKYLLALALFLTPSIAMAQCNGVFPNNTVCGNVSGASNLPRAVSNSVLTGVPGGLNGQVQFNNAGVFGGLTNTQLTALINPFTSILSGAVPLSGGGTTNFLRADGTWVSPSFTYIAPGTGAVAISLQNKLNHMQVSIGDYGAVCNGTTDDTTAIQNAWNAGGAVGINTNLSGIGTVCKISSLTMPAPIQPPNVNLKAPVSSHLVGDGPNSVTLVSTVTGTACAITITTPFTTNQPTGEMGGFGLTQTSNAGVGDGNCLNQVTNLSIRNVLISGFSSGLLTVDTINLHVKDSIFSSNVVHILGTSGSNSRSNAWTIESNSFNFAATSAIFINNGAMINIVNNTFEKQRGTNLAEHSRDHSPPEDLPIDGFFGARIEGNYFEDGQETEITISAVSGSTAQASYTIASNLFVRSNNTEDQIIFLSNPATTTMLISINLMGNSFFDAPSCRRCGIFCSSLPPSAATPQALCLVQRRPLTRAPMVTKCLRPTASATLSMDTFGIFGFPFARISAPFAAAAGEAGAPHPLRLYIR